MRKVQGSPNTSVNIVVYDVVMNSQDRCPGLQFIPRVGGHLMPYMLTSLNAPKKTLGPRESGPGKNNDGDLVENENANDKLEADYSNTPEYESLW